MRVLHLLLSFVLLTTTCFGQNLKPVRGMPFVNRAHPLAPTAGWLMNEGSGNKVFDLSGNSNTGNESGGVLWKPGKFGISTYYDGTNDYFALSRTSWLKTRDFTVVGWAYTTSTGEGEEYFFAGLDGNNHLIQLGMYQSKMRLGIWDGSAFKTITGDTAIDDGIVHQFAWTVKANGWGRCYLDGVPDVAWTDLSACSNVVIDTTFAIGARGGSFAWGPGGIEMLYVFQPCLIEEQIALLYQEPFCMFRRENVALMVEAAAPPSVVPTPYYYRGFIPLPVIPLGLLCLYCVYLGRRKCAA